MKNTVCLIALFSLIAVSCIKKYQVIETENWGTIKLNDSVQTLYDNLVQYQGYLDSDEYKLLMKDVYSQALKRQTAIYESEGVSDEELIETAADDLVQTNTEEALSYIYLGIFTSDSTEIEKPGGLFSNYIIDGFNKYKENESHKVKLSEYSIIKDEPYGLVIRVTDLTSNKKYDISYQDEGYPEIDAVE